MPAFFMGVIRVVVMGIHTVVRQMAKHLPELVCVALVLVALPHSETVLMVFAGGVYA